ncbi:MAG TPA: hypothetical protein VJ725_30535 [Thermoanaerobaculia bacterium]|nr:hypothetical protein [Thermoanaerobaculia bacterium]
MSSLTSDQTMASPPAPPAGAAARPAGPVRPSSLNLARRPFVNSRPVVRTAVALWLLGLLLLLGNVYLFWNYRTGSADKRGEIEEREGQSAREQERVRDLETRLRGMDLDQQNAQIDFLNRKIDERTFSWSLLFDRLAAVMPNDVRLKRLTPITSAQLEERLRAQGTSAQRRVAQGQVLLAITAEAKSDEAVFQFVDNLFRHPESFRDANWTRRILDEDTNIVEYEITVAYLPQSASRPTAAGETPVLVEEGSPATPAPGTPATPPGGTPR